MVADALRRGTLLTVSATSGSQSRGYVCDRDSLGLLLDLHNVPGETTTVLSVVERRAPNDPGGSSLEAGRGGSP